jgi:hypothetical protein
MLRSARHRARQFFGALRPRVDPAARADACARLDEPQRRLFESMTLRDQQHGIAVYRAVRAAAPDDAGLQVAALLHDCGKGHVRLWHRVAFVVLEAAAPPLLERVASAEGAAWRRALWRLRHHPLLGADLVAATGADPDVVRIIREQELKPPPDARLALLQAADEQ